MINGTCLNGCINGYWGDLCLKSILFSISFVEPNLSSDLQSVQKVFFYVAFTPKVHNFNLTPIVSKCVKSDRVYHQAHHFNRAMFEMSLLKELYMRLLVMMYEKSCAEFELFFCTTVQSCVSFIFLL